MNVRSHAGARPEPLCSNPTVYQTAHGAGSKAELGFPLHCCFLRGSLTSNIIISLLQVRKPRLRKIEFTCLEIIQIAGDGDRSVGIAWPFTCAGGVTM